MFTKITLAEKESAKALVIPSNAIIFDGGKNYVVIYKDKFHVDAQEVKSFKG